MENNRKLSASCIVIRENKVLLVKHTYGAAAGKYLIPGGFSEDGEMLSENVVDTTKELVRSVLDVKKPVLKISDFINSRFDISTWQLYI